MQATNNRPPLQIKNKDKYIAAQVTRFISQFSIPKASTMPSPFPQPTLQPQRALCAVSVSHPEKLSECFAAFYHAFFVELQTIGKPEVFGECLKKVLGEGDAEKVLEATGGSEAKKLLTENTELALEEGAFGLPWFVATNVKGEKEGYVMM